MWIIGDRSLFRRILKTMEKAGDSENKQLFWRVLLPETEKKNEVGGREMDVLVC